MKKIFTLIAVAMMALGVNAETLIDFSQKKDHGITVGGTTTIDAVKIKSNTTSIPGIKFANSYSTEGVSNGNNAELTVEGGFKAGDVITIAGAFNNADDTKKSGRRRLALHPGDIGTRQKIRRQVCEFCGRETGRGVRRQAEHREVG